MGDQTDRDRRVQRSVRSQRVELAGLVPCARCGGTTDPVEDTTLACGCAAQDAEFRARMARVAMDHRGPRDDDRSDRIAP